MGAPDATAQIAAARRGSVRALARLVTEVENGGSGAQDIAAALTGTARGAHVIGITGSPGAGKSTLTAALLRELRAEAATTVAVLAVDPSSPHTGGALLGDRVRMGDFATDPGVFIRSLSARGRLGGISAGTPAAVDLLSALGFDLVIIETVGVGQSEVDIMDLADSVVVVLTPGMGDAVQAAKAGILEIADILVVNKADRPGAKATVRDLRAALTLGTPTAERGRRIPVIATIAESGEGVDTLAAALAEHRRYLIDTGGLTERAQRRTGSMIAALVAERVRRDLADDPGRRVIAAAAKGVIDGETDPYRAADTVWRTLPRGQA